MLSCQPLSNIGPARNDLLLILDVVMKYRHLKFAEDNLNQLWEGILASHWLLVGCSVRSSMRPAKTECDEGSSDAGMTVHSFAVSPFLSIGSGKG